MESLSSALSHLEDCPSEQYPQFIVEEVEAQREKMSCLRLHSKLKARYPAQLSGFFLDPTAWRSFPNTNSIRLLLSTLINRRQGHESLQNKMWYLGEKENSLPNTPALQPRAMKPQKHFPVSQALGFFSAEVPCWKCQGHPSRSHQRGRRLASWPTLGSAPTAGGTSVFQYSHVFPQSNWLALSPSISPLPFHLFYFYFSSQALLFLYFSCYFSGLCIGLRASLSSFHVWLFCPQPSFLAVFVHQALCLGCLSSLFIVILPEMLPCHSGTWILIFIARLKFCHPSVLSLWVNFFSHRFSWRKKKIPFSGLMIHLVACVLTWMLVLPLIIHYFNRSCQGSRGGRRQWMVLFPVIENPSFPCSV